MSKPTQSTAGGKPAPQPRSLAGSVWARGPPQSSQPASQNASPLQSPNPNNNKEKLAGTESAPVSAPSSGRQSQAGQSRKAAAPAAAADAAPVAAAKAVSIPTPPVAATPAKASGLNFGTIDNPESVISSSPAAKPTTGAHLGEGEKVKSFGSVAAAAASAPAAPAAASTEKAAPAPSKPKFDPHKMFQKAPQAQAPAAAAAPAPAAATPSPAPSNSNPISPAPAPIALASPAPVPQQQQQPNPYASMHLQQHGQPGIQQARGYNANGQPMVHSQPFTPSGGPPNGRVPHRSPIMGNAQPHVQPGFNPATSGVFQPAGPGGVRPGGRPTGQPMNRGGPGFPPQMQGQQFQGMPQQGYSPYQQHYGGYGGEFQPQYPYGQHFQGMPGASGQPGGAPPVGSPNMGRPQLQNASSSFSSQTSGLPTPGGQGAASPMSPQPTPGTPMQNHRAPALFTPGAAPFSPGAATFTPGGAPSAISLPKVKSSAIKITRADGTPLDLSTEAKKVKGSGPSAAALALSASAAATASPKPAVATPVVVRIESPVQKQERERELEAEKKRKEDDARAEKERLERKEAKEREDKETAEKAQKEVADKAQADKEKAEVAAEADKKAEDDKVEQEKKAADEKVVADKKDAEDKQVAEDKKVADDKKVEDDKKASEAADAAKSVESAPASEPVETKPLSFAGLPSKPSHEVLEKAKLAAPELDSFSAASTPRGSPAMSHASLASVPEGRKAPPAALEVVASNLALKTAKVIEDIRAITYPASISAPNPALNASAKDGKFRYDREFLLQFMNICKEKVDYEASLESLIDKHSVRNDGPSRSGSPRPRGGMGSRAGSHMGPMGGFTKPGGSGGMGTFGTGSFGTRPPATSEERLAASRNNLGNAFAGARNSQASLSRTNSHTSMNQMGQGGMRNDPSRARSARGGKPRDGGGRGPAQPMLDQNVAPLEASENRWTPAVQSRRPGALDENSPEFVERKVKGLLNKLTAEKFESISNQILEWANKSVNEKDGQTLRLVIKLIFEKAKDEQFWSKMYASLCHKLWRDISPDVKDEAMLAADGKPLSGGLLFRKYLLNRCQEDFEKGWKQKADASAAAKEKAADDLKKKAEHDAAVEAGGQVEEFKFSDEYYAEAAAKRQGLGLIKFIGELFKLEILSTKVIHSCIVKLLGNVVDPDEEDIESLSQLLTTVGAKLEAQPKMSQQVDLYMQRMNDLARSEHLTSRIRFMVEDVIELRRHRWQTRSTKGEGGPMTIEQVHAQARAEAEASRIAASRVNTSSMSRANSASRGGSPRDRERGGFGGDAWTPVGAKLPPKPADMTQFGKIASSGGFPNFGPQSVFGKKKGGKVSEDITPPLSRTPSSNMFSALLEGNDDVESASSPPEAPQQRKRLQLQPRTVSSTDTDKADATNEEEDAETAADGETENGEMSDEQIEQKIKNDVEELWGAKDQGGTRKPTDIVEYFESLPEAGRTKLAAKLVEDVFRLSKQSDTDVVVKGFELAFEQDVLTSEQAKEALLPQIELLDDLSVDVPKAYDFAAELIIVSNLESEVDAFGDAIETYGEPRITPKSKLLAAVAKQTGGSA